METTNKIVIFILVITTVVAVMLTGLREVTMSTALQNEDVFNKRAILAALGENLDKSPDSMSDAEVLTVFNDKMEQVVLDMDGNVVKDAKAEKIDMAKEKKKPEAERQLPLYVYSSGGEKFYIVSVRGNGLWDEIWGTIAFKSDLNTVAGASFDHKGETPGLGAEIKDNPTFPSRFKGTKIYDGSGEYVGITVRKQGKRNDHEVDGITGATVTADGVTEMLVRGIKYYQPYFEKVGKDKKVLGLK